MEERKNKKDVPTRKSKYYAMLFSVHEIHPNPTRPHEMKTHENSLLFLMSHGENPQFYLFPLEITRFPLDDPKI